MDQIVSFCRVESWVGLVVVIVISLAAVAISFYIDVRLIRLLHGSPKSTVHYKLEKFFKCYGWKAIQSVLEQLPSSTVSLLCRVMNDKYCSLEMQAQLAHDLHSETAKLLARFRVSVLVFAPVTSTLLVLIVMLVANVAREATLVSWVAGAVVSVALTASITLVLATREYYQNLRRLRMQLEQGAQALYARLDL
jgi:hypothetical protein